MQETLNILAISPMTVHNGPGNRTLVHTKGCPLRCLWCSTPESQLVYKQLAYNDAVCYGCGLCIPSCPQGAITLSSAESLKAIINRELCNDCFLCISSCHAKALKIYGEDLTVDAVLEKILRYKNYYLHSGGGITFSGGEPLMDVSDPLILLCQALKEEKITIGFDTTGYVSRKNIERTMEYTDFYLWDIKEMDTNKHYKLTGVHNELILENLAFVDSKKIPVYLRHPVLPKINDTIDNLNRICELASTMSSFVELHLMPIHHLGQNRYKYLGWKYPINSSLSITSDEMNEKRLYVEKQGIKCKVIG